MTKQGKSTRAFRRRLAAVAAIAALVGAGGVVTAGLAAPPLSVSNAQANLTDDVGGQASQYTVTFNTSQTGALVVGPAGAPAITLSAPPRTVFPASASDYKVDDPNAHTGFDETPPSVTLSQDNASVTIPVTGTVEPGDQVTVVVSSVTNPPPGTYKDFAVQTTSDTTPADAGQYTIAGLPSAANSTVVADSPDPAVGGPLPSTGITVTLEDSQGTPVTDQDVTLAPSGHATIALGASLSTGPGSNTVLFGAYDTTPETVTFTATSDGVSIPSNPVVFYGPPSAANSTVSASPASVPADGVTASTITVTVLDVNDQPIPNAQVSLKASPSATATVSPAQTSDSNGQTTFTVTDTKAETVTFTATATAVTQTPVTITQTASVTFLKVPPAPTPSAANSTVSASPASVPADGATASTITVTVLDVNGQPVPGAQVSLKASPSATATVSPAQTSDSNGKATFSATDTKAETVTFSAKAGATSITQTAAVTFTATSVTSPAVTVAPALPDTSGAYTVSFTTSPNAGALAAGATITLTAAGGGTTFSTTPCVSAQVLPSPGACANPGAYVVLDQKTDKAAEATQVTVSQNGTEAVVTVPSSVTIGAGDTVDVEIATAHNELAGNYYLGIATSSDQGTVWAPYQIGAPGLGTQVSHASVAPTTSLAGQTGVGYTVSFTTSATTGAVPPGGSITLDAPGTGFPTSASDYTVMALPPSSVTQNCPPAVSQECPADAPVTVAAVAPNRAGSGVTLTLATPVPPNTKVTITTANDVTNPTALGPYSSFTIATSADPVAAAARAYSISGPPSATASTLDPPFAQVGVSATSAITVTLEDASANPVTGQPVALTASPSTTATVSPAQTTTDNNGKAAFAVGDATPETPTFTASSASVTVAQTAQVEFYGAPDPAKSTVVANPASVAAGGSGSTVTVTVRDSANQPVPRRTITLGAGGSSSVGGSPATTTAPGRATFTVTDSTPETVTVTAEDVTDPTNPFVLGSATVTFT